MEETLTGRHPYVPQPGDQTCTLSGVRGIAPPEPPGRGGCLAPSRGPGKGTALAARERGAQGGAPAGLAKEPSSAGLPLRASPAGPRAVLAPQTTEGAGTRTL